METALVISKEHTTGLKEIIKVGFSHSEGGMIGINGTFFSWDDEPSFGMLEESLKKYCLHDNVVRFIESIINEKKNPTSYPEEFIIMDGPSCSYVYVRGMHFIPLPEDLSDGNFCCQFISVVCEYRALDKAIYEKNQIVEQKRKASEIIDRRLESYNGACARLQKCVELAEKKKVEEAEAEKEQAERTRMGGCWCAPELPLVNEESKKEEIKQKDQQPSLAEVIAKLEELTKKIAALQVSK